VRLLFALVVLVFLGTFAPLRLQKPEPVPAVTILTFEAAGPEEKRIGRLTFLEGWNIESDDLRFGGLSTLHVEDGAVLAFSDSGLSIRFPLPRGGPVRAEISPLPNGPGTASAKADRDVEAMVVLGPLAWIAFERANQVWRYHRDGWRSDSSASPAAMREWRGNRGSEAMVRLPDGRFLILSEGDGGEALLFSGDPAVKGTPWRALKYRPPEGYLITDAAVLPDGRLLFLNRSAGITGFSAKLSLGRFADEQDRAAITGEEIATLDGLDNLEGLSVTQEEGRTIVWLASDDNFNPLQRTLLLKFALEL
jgi:hypothetical protein